MVKLIVRGLAPAFGLMLVFLPADAVPAKPGGSSHKPASPAASIPGKDFKKQLITPFCGRHQDQQDQQGQQSGHKFVRPQRRRTILDAKYALGAIGDTIPLRATLTLDKKGGPVPSQMVEFRVDGQVVGEALTNNKGEARVDYKVPNKWGPKPVSVKFLGNHKCRGASDNTNVGTVRSSTTLSFGGDFANKGSPTRLSGTLKRTTDGKGVGGREVAIYINNYKVTTLLTDSGGGLSYDFTPGLGSSGSKMRVKAQFLGDVLYNPTAATDSIKVYPRRKTAYLRWASVTGMYGETVTAFAHVTDGMAFPAGKRLSGVEVNMWRERGERWAPPRVGSAKVGSATTNHMGIAMVTFTIRDKPMKYSLNAHAEVAVERFDLNKYNGLYGAYLTVLPATVDLKVTGPSTVHVGDSVPYQVTAKRTTDNQRVEGLLVCVANSGCTKTDQSGKATVSYKVPSQGGTGPRQVEFYNQADDYHVKSTTKITVTAKPSVN